jgi:16S rRNA (cytosine967-C5)-methyltransferase
MGFENIKTIVWDAFSEDTDAAGKADIVIADLPCSGLGVIGKKSDIKYNMTREKQQELVKVQRCILKNAVKLMKKGGTLIYSTCTTNKEENYENFCWLREELQLSPVDISSLFPVEIAGDTAKDGYVQLLPGINKSDGFFISRFTN